VIPHLGTVLPLLGKYWKPVGIAFAVGAVLGFWLGWRVNRPVSIRETAAPAVTLPSGAVIAERVPDKPLPPVAKEAAKALKGKPTRGGHVVVQPALLSTPSNSTQPQSLESGERDNLACSCAPVRLDWALLDVDGGQRMALQAFGGTITSAVDTPVGVTRFGRPKLWAAGGLVEFTSDGDKRYGLWLDRELGPFVLGVEASHGSTGIAGEIRAGIRF
jgi:hypothetical protein